MNQSKTKKINKNNKKKNNKNDNLQTVQKRNQQNDDNDDINKGQPILKNLSDFVTAITPTYVSRPIYTGGRILTGQSKIYSSCNHQITIYDIKTQQITQKIKHKNEQIINFAIDPLQKSIITFTNTSLLRVINIQTQKVLHKLKLNPKLYIYDISYSIDGKFLAIGFANSMIKIYTTQTMKQTHSYTNHKMAVRKLQWHKNTQTLQIISIDQDRNLIVFDYILNKVIAHVKNCGKNFVQTPKGTSIIVSSDKQIKIYDFKTFKLERTIQLEQQEYIDSLFYLQNGILIFGGEETKVYNIDLNDKNYEIRNDIVTADIGVLKILPISGNKQLLVVSAEQNLTLVDAKKLTTIQTVIGFNDQIIDIKYSKSSRKQKNQSQFIVIITNSNNAKIFNRYTLKLVSFITGHQDTILCCQYFHPYLLTAGKDKIIKLHEIDPLGRAKLIANYRGHSQYICGLGVLIDSKIIISASEDKTLKLWPIVQQKQHKIQIKNALSTIAAHPKSINAVRTSPNQDFIATCSHDRTAKIWGPNLQLFFTLSGHKRGVWDAAFHPIQKLVVTVAGDGALKGWSLFNGQCLWSLGQGFAIMRCQWIYHHQVITSSIDGIVKIWDIRKQTSLSYDKHQGKIWALQVIKDQTNNNKVQILTGANDSTFYVWKDTTQSTRQKIMKTQQLQQQERIQYDQLMYDRKYLEAAKLAFQNNYTQLFINTVNRVFNQIDNEKDVEVKFEDGKLMIDQKNQQENNRQQFSQAELKKFSKELFVFDSNRLLNILYMMTSTVKNYKSAQTIFLSLLKSVPLSQIIQMEKRFTLTSRKNNSDLQDLNSNKSQFEEFLQKMEVYTQKHLNRLQRYIRGTYYMDHLNKRQKII